MKPQHDAINDIRVAKEAAATLKAHADALADRHQALVKDRTAIATASPALEEILANMQRLVDEASARWNESHTRVLIDFIGGYNEPWSTGGVRTVPPQLPANRPHEGRDAIGFEELCGLAPELMKARIERTLRAADPAPYGLPVDERTRRLAELDAEIAEHEAAHTQLVDAAADVGIPLPLLPAVRARREQEAAEAVRQAELARQRELAARRAGGPPW